MTEAMLNKMNIFANGFANERVDEAVAKITESMLDDADGEQNFNRIKKEIGRWLALAYSKGYGDAVENLDVKKLIF